MFTKPMLVVIDNDDESVPLRDRENLIPVMSFDPDFALAVAERWLAAYPKDIIMYVEVEHSICMHCGVSIHEDPGWILHKWIHDRGGRVCLTPAPPALTKAEPL